MALATGPKKEIQRIGIKKSKNMLYSGTSLASAESLTVPLVQEVVLSADIRCAECQKRVADIMSRMNETESVSINVLEKKGRLTCLRWLQFCITQTFANKKEMLRLMCHGVKQSTEVKLGITGQTCQTKPPRSAQVASDSKMNGKDFQRTFQKPKIQKARRIILNMKEVETHMIEKQQCRISVCGRFRPSDVAIKLRKKMNRRVEIMDTQEFASSNEQEDPPP